MGRPPHRSRAWFVWPGLLVVVGLAAAGGFYLAGPTALGTPGTPAGAVAATTAASPATLEAATRALRELHSLATSATSTRTDTVRATAARTEVERFLASEAPEADRQRTREALEVHLLAVSAARARTLDRTETWEAVGLDPAVDLCPSLKFVVDHAAQRPNASRARTRGAAVAGALPLLWDCANERIAALEQGLPAR